MTVIYFLGDSRARIETRLNLANRALLIELCKQNLRASARKALRRPALQTLQVVRWIRLSPEVGAEIRD